MKSFNNFITEASKRDDDLLKDILNLSIPEYKRNKITDKELMNMDFWVMTKTSYSWKKPTTDRIVKNVKLSNLKKLEKAGLIKLLHKDDRKTGVLKPATFGKESEWGHNAESEELYIKLTKKGVNKFRE